MGEVEGETKGDTWQKEETVSVLLLVESGTLMDTMGEMKQSGDMDCVLVRVAEAVMLTKTGVPSAAPSPPSCKNVFHAKD